jgi:hypothetical protein
MYTQIEEAVNKDHKFPKQNGMFLTHFYIGYINTHTRMIHAVFMASWMKEFTSAFSSISDVHA